MKELIQSLVGTNIVMIGVAAVVIGCFVAIAVILFQRFFKYYSKCVKKGLIDDELREALIEEYKAFFVHVEDVVNSGQVDLKVVEDMSMFAPYVKKHDGKRKKKKIVSRCIDGIFYLLFAVITGLLVLGNISSNPIFLAKKSALVVATGSMETVADTNLYIEENDLNDQLPRFSLVFIEKVTKPEDIKLFDIIAYKSPDNDIIIHRVIDVDYDANVYTCRGDANTASLSYEKAVAFDNVVGRFTGTQYKYMGFAISFLKSSIGLITIVATFTVLTVMSSYERKLENLKYTRVEPIALAIDEEIKEAIREGTIVHFIKEE